MTIQQAKNHLSAQLHGGSLNKVRNIYELFERAQNNLLGLIKPIECIRIAAISNTVHDDIYNYLLASDFGEIIDLLPQDERESNDAVSRQYSQRFDLRKAIANKTVVIEGSEGSKIIRINWRSKTPITIHPMNDYDNNGTWSAFGTASNIEQDTITYYSGNGSVRFDLATSGDGIQCNDMSEIDLSDEDESGDVFLWFYIKNSTDLGNLNSVTVRWGNTLTTQLWTGVAQTMQADGNAFRVGWNLIRVPWSTATETGTVTPSEIDSVKITFDIDAAISDVRVDNIICSRGRNFDIKYYSKYVFKNSAGTWIGLPTTDDDTIVLDNDANNIFLYLALIEAAQQIEGSDSSFDINYATNKLFGPRGDNGLIAKYNAKYPSQVKKAITSYGSNPARGRW